MAQTNNPIPVLMCWITGHKYLKIDLGSDALGVRSYWRYECERCGKVKK